MKKICVITGSRAEYGILKNLIKKIDQDKELELYLIATGMHLSPEFGLTYKEIEKDFNIDKKIEMLLSSDTAVGISKSMGLAQISFSEVFNELQPDLIIVLGDRYEIFAAASAAMIANIPIAHIHGGETTQGAFDEAIRHSITKMSHLHFTSTQEYKNRVIQLGENPNRVFNVGALGVENIKNVQLLSKEELEESINFRLGVKNLIVTFHPATLENSTAQQQFQELLNAIDELENTNIIFTKANSDKDGRIINKMIDDYTSQNKNNTIAFTSLGQLRYFSTLQFIDAVVGNSSSGIIEAPTFKIATINIGDRQKGRITANSVIDTPAIKKHILDSIYKVYSQEFKDNLRIISNPYETSNTADSIVKTIKDTNFTNITKKSFWDL
ncbi:MAG: UDP-N-acetylglucosamine 2-epimerase [Campylobacterota bacterium]|nr:UDP-N-acetylglucosamine 2-epimerase [Campylobacterota bacterium]